MKKLFLIAGLMAAFVLAVASVSASGAPNFAGTWVLDKSKSQGLDQRMQNAESVTCVITQDDKTLSMDWKIAGGQTGAPGSGAGGGGGAGRGPSGPRTYNLDGKEVTSEGQMGKSSMKATWSSDMSSLELMTVRSGNRDGQEFKFTTTDKLSLSADGKVLTINRHSESSRGSTDSTLVFNKQ